MPPQALGIVVFAHGSGSSRKSPRNIEAARRLNEAALGTLLFDLLTPAEAEERANVLDIVLLAERLVVAEKWLRTWPGLGNLPIALLGASTGAAAALVAAARLGTDIAAVVSRGGRPDLAGPALGHVTAPTHLFGEPGAIEEVSRLAAEWFAKHLTEAGHGRRLTLAGLLG